MYKTHTPSLPSSPNLLSKKIPTTPFFSAKIFHFVLNIHSSLVDYTDACCIYEINVLRIYSYYTHTLIQMPLLPPPTHIYISDIYSIYEWQLSDLLIATWAGYTTMLGR